MASPGPKIVVVGSANADLVANVPRLPAPGETVVATGYTEVPGGKGANQAVAAARLGLPVAFLGAVGDDAHGALLTEALTAEGVDVAHLARRSGVPTGRALVLVDDAGENSIVVVAGANGTVGPQDVLRAAGELRAAAVTLAQLEIPLDAVAAAARVARGLFVLNPAPAAPLEEELLRDVDVLVLNEHEFSVVTGVEPADTPAGFARSIAEAGLRCPVVVTLGGRGAMAWDRGEARAHAAPEVTVVDTTGAGDTFVGALADALARGRPLADAVPWAVAAASLSTRALGATTAMPRRDDVEAILSRRR